MSPILALAVFVAACGFTPIHKFDATAPTLDVAALEVSGDTIARGLRRALAKRVSVNPQAGMRLDIELSRRQREVQKATNGVALRLELRHQAEVTLRRGETVTRKSFALTQFMTRGDSGADELSQIRALDDLAVRDLSGQIIDYLSTQNARGGGR